MRKWSAHLQYSWWKYLLLVVVTVCVWCGVFSSLAKPAANTRVGVLYLGEKLDVQMLQQELQTTLLPELSGAIRAITVEAAVFPDEMFEQLLLAKTYEYDLILISESYMRENIGQEYFLRLSTEQLPGGYIYYCEMAGQSEKPYGILLPNEEEVCYAFISPLSVNVYPLNDQSKEGDRGALEVLEYLLNEK